MLPAPGQGALAIQCRDDDDSILELLAAIDDPRARAETTAERVFLQTLAAGCTAPVGAFAETVRTDGAYAGVGRFSGRPRRRSRLRHRRAHGAGSEARR